MSEDALDVIWRPRSTAETRALYAEWAPTYDQDMAAWSYATPARLALALRRAGVNPDKPALDFGCGTGLSGMALRSAGFSQIDGADISPEMLAVAGTRGVYQHLWETDPEDMGHVRRGTYPILIAAGVIGVGCAPPETLDLLIGILPSGGFLAFSFDAPTLADRTYTDRLDIAVLAPDIEILSEDDGPHLPGLDIGSTIYVLTRT